jgi:uncharacterized protein
MRVDARPRQGQANPAVVALLAKPLGVPKSTISAVSGAAARLKTVALAGDGEAPAANLARC